MTMSRSILLALALPALVMAACDNVVGPCTKANMEDQCDLIKSKTEAEVAAACNLAGLPFSSLTQQGYQNDQNYMDGASTDFHKDADSLAEKQGRLLAYQELAHRYRKVGWPEYNAADMHNFEDCKLETAMCCFINAPTLDSQICHHDIAESRASSRLYRGFAAFDKNLPAYCVGFSWAGSEVNDSFKGNLLAEISYGNMMDKHGNAPGAPLCGCVEKMPAVTKADCIKAEAEGEAYSVEADSTLPGGLLIIAKPGLTIDYVPCADGDLLESYAGEDNGQIEKKLVGTCDTNKFLNHYFYQPGTSPVWDEPDPMVWQKMMGQGMNYVAYRDPDLDARNDYFMEVFNSSPNKIVYRRCPQCMPSHQHIYYKRLTAVPDSLNFIDLFMNNWFDTNANTLNVDFKLYSTYEEAVAGNGGEWQFCNFNDATVGFPRDCGPVGKVNCQWGSHVRTPCTNGDYNTYSHAFYIEIAEPTIGSVGLF